MNSFATIANESGPVGAKASPGRFACGLDKAMVAGIRPSQIRAGGCYLMEDAASTTQVIIIERSCDKGWRARKWGGGDLFTVKSERICGEVTPAGQAALVQAARRA